MRQKEGNAGLSWQKDASWGSYHVTTLHAYNPVVLENALIYSDNIYFAKAALKIGADEMKDSLLRLGFQEEMPFEVVMSKSQYSNTENIETEIQLADSGYGQGQILVNPLHMACIYTAFCNKGNVIKPYFVYRPDAEPEYWIPNAFSENTTNLVLEGIKKVINDAHGTGMRHIGMTFCWQGKQEQQRSKSRKRILPVQSLDGLLFLQQKVQKNIQF